MSEIDIETAVKGATDLTLSSPDEEQMRGRVGRWAHRFLGLSGHEFEDPYQAAWVRVMEYVRAGRPIRNLEHFLRWEVGNSWKMELRRRRRRPSVGFEDCSDLVLRNLVAPDVADHVERLEDARLLLGLIAGMQPRRQQVLMLREAWGLAPVEVCELLGITGRTYREEHAKAVREIHTQFSLDADTG